MPVNSYRIHYFGLLGDRRGLTEEKVSSNAITAGELYQTLAATHALGIQAQHLRAAVNDELVPWNHPLADGDQVAFLPPMSGG
ncbi:MAG: MoaD/ThiS family protein [Akkermansiaceae bacterium]|jgi:molybdopterin synthase sulfur carrier subunit|nr:MoaD/ThiS family protein [Akkermansiaceae bacterium]